MEEIILLLVGLFGVFAFISGVIILFNRKFGKRFFENWNTIKLNLVRLVVTGTIFTASSFTPQSSHIFIAGCFFAIATIFYFIMGHWQEGRNFVQSFLVESHNGERIYVLCIIIPTALLLIKGAFF